MPSAAASWDRLAAQPFEYIVPVLTPRDGDWWSVAWIGVDGYNSSDVVQIGTGQHVNRSGGKVTTEYFAWVEWYTYLAMGEIRAVNPVSRRSQICRAGAPPAAF